jgi:hypothetical protein
VARISERRPLDRLGHSDPRRRLQRRTATLERSAVLVVLGERKKRISPARQAKGGSHKEKLPPSNCTRRVPKWALPTATALAFTYRTDTVRTAAHARTPMRAYPGWTAQQPLAYPSYLSGKAECARNRLRATVPIRRSVSRRSRLGCAVTIPCIRAYRPVRVPLTRSRADRLYSPVSSVAFPSPSLQTLIERHDLFLAHPTLPVTLLRFA